MTSRKKRYIVHKSYSVSKLNNNEYLDLDIDEIKRGLKSVQNMLNAQTQTNISENTLCDQEIYNVDIMYYSE
ncbi:hypothetical protein [Jeotgalibacillus soli]|uniref:Uncharacterized protein n=1 Tax=Jeotgalibacillus soli TaxID=889306 RepID=A0A0C2VMG6_9BACL|nr:hypothetical protein [Jeotgalibacillus soli]KIL45198.1 hypothetical protein KP78_27420 [Jeotgalibacillus soli]